MLARVRRKWIEDVLEPALDGAPRIELELIRNSAVGNRSRLPPGTTLREVFDKAGGGLLILGAPGSGKTFALLELLRDLLDQAEQDPTGRIPVVVNLASWAQQRLPLADWLIDELHDSYDVPRRIAQEWVTAGDVLPLLDGLDEVAEESRAGCVAAINDFLDDYFGGLVVCSRTQDYGTLSTRLRLGETLELQPPTRQQVRDYLDAAGAPLADVRRALGADDSLWKLLASPLMLDIVARTYQGRPAESLRMTGKPRQRRVQLFTEYVEQMFARRPITADYTQPQARHWLTSLAQSLRDRDQSEFHLDRLQPDWLPTSTQQRRVITLAILAVVVLGLGGGLLLGLIGGLIAQLGFGITEGLVDCLLIGLAGGLVVALVWGLAAAGRGPPYGLLNPWNGLRWSWSGLAVGVIVGSAVGLTFEVLTKGVGLFFGPLIGLLAADLAARMGGEPSRQGARVIARAEELRWSRKGLAVGLLIGLAVGLGGGLAVALDRGPTLGWAFGSVFGLLAAVVGAQLTAHMSGRRADSLTHGAAEVAPAPLWSQTGLIVGLASTLTVGLGFGLSIGRAVDLTLGLGGGLLSGLLTALVAALVSGKRADKLSRLGAGGTAPTPRDKGVFRRFSRLATGLVVGLFFCLFFVGAGEVVLGLIGGPLFGLGSGLAAATGSGASVGVPFGLVIGLVGVAAFGPVGGVIGGLLLGLISGILAADGRAATLFRGQEGKVARQTIEPIEGVCWSWAGLGFGLLAGPLFGLGLGLASGELAIGLAMAPGMGLAMGAAGGLCIELTDKRAVPNEGIRRSARYSLIAGALGGLVFGLIAGPPLGLRGGLAVGLLGGLCCGLLGAVGTGLMFGGNACLRHLALRWLLVRNDAAPWHYVGFLNDMTACRFLLRSGSGYLFLHRMLLDHFAGEQSPAAGRSPWSATPDDHDWDGGSV